MNYYNDIKKIIVDNEIYTRVKDYSKERHKVKTYFEIGKLLSEAGKEYGKNIIGEYSERLMIEVGKKYDKSLLFRMRKFYQTFSNEKVAPLVPQLSWSQILILLPLKSIGEVLYYSNQVSKRNLTKRGLEEIIKNKEYERLPQRTKEKLSNDEKLELIDIVPNPIVIKSNESEVISEKILQRVILENISSFLKALGTGFTFLDNEFKIKIGDRYNYIDLLLFNIEYNCFVVVELKLGELKKEHIGQIEIYMNYINKNIKKINHNKTLGIIICKKNNNLLIEYSSDKRIIPREYILI